MALSVEKLLTDAHTLVVHLRNHDTMYDNIITATQTLHNKMEAMKQYEDDITELNEIANHRPRSTMVLGLAQENRQIRDLQHENRELQAALEEHQSALELIMQKYREHTVRLLQSNTVEKTIQERDIKNKDSVCFLMDKIDEMAGVMQKAIEVDDRQGCADGERLSCLEVENRTLREMLEICSTGKVKILPSEMKNSIETAEEESDSEDDKTDSDSSILLSPNMKKNIEDNKNNDKQKKKSSVIDSENGLYAENTDITNKESNTLGARESASDIRKERTISVVATES